ncbi:MULTISPECIES: 4'-phosphopantetheinyl transferase superfamily protein [Clostridium]|uniref:4'-phosphopantetheinyl transferase superfamily protein n=1 Tax=Clostridium cibarium TaxID=2762247 RepID=A0ABR8PW18_9CLOT|nr:MULTISPECIES: 4'-phosphopantetheinyl transferase superfamily protein [Clostridium]MBD7912364.1 4'-phosphopantetheinyl transferase superfamily protein [Clostridium cibarium]
MEVYIFNIDEILDIFDFKKFYDFVDKDKRKKIQKFRRDEDKIRSLVGEALARIKICEKLGCKNFNIKFEHNEYGKPYIKENIEFNISHSGSYVIVAIDDCALGIDIEEMKEIEFEGIAKGYFDESEYNWIINHDKEKQKKCFYKLWTLKESYVKYVGKGLSIGFNSFKFNIDENRNILEIDSDSEDIYFKNYDMLDKYQLSVCSKKDEVILKEVDYKFLCEMMKKYEE